MSVGGKSRREAKSAQDQAIREQNRILQQAQSAQQAYRDSFDTRNADLIRLVGEAGARLEALESGADISSIYPMLTATLMQGAEAVESTTKFTQGLGTNALEVGDTDYQRKLQSVTARRIARSLAEATAQGAIAERNRDTGIVVEGNSALNADRMAGLGLYNQAFSMANAHVSSTATRLSMERQRGMQALSPWMSLASGFMGSFAGGLGAGLGSKILAGSAGNTGGTPPFIPISSTGMTPYNPMTGRP